MNQPNISQKATQSISRKDLVQLLAVARGEKTADLLIKNVRILDLVNGEISLSNILISKKWIAGVGPEYSSAKAKKIFDANNMVAVPGFIDSHLHIESSLMNPFEFEQTTLPLGTTTVICDPHEITNVIGKRGYDWFLRCSQLTTQNMFVQASSCVPALQGVETNGADFPIKELKRIRNHPNVLGLAEMMNFPGTISGDKNTLDKLELFETLSIDGHGPMLSGVELNAYVAAGVQNCHETISSKEALEKLKSGMSVMIREGSVAKNLKALAPVLNDFNSINCMLCTDDRNPYEIAHEGHINFIVKQLINEYNVKPHIAYRVSSYSAARHFNLKRLGLIAPGKQADIILMNDYEKVDINSVLIKGEWVEKGKIQKQFTGKLKKSAPPVSNTIKRKKTSSSDFEIKLANGKYNVIEIVPNEIITKHLQLTYNNGFNVEDVVTIAVCERYGKNLPVALGLVKGFNIKNGAIASSVAHDSHNIIVVGDNASDISVAVNALIKAGGGFAVSQNGKILEMLELPLAGLMSMNHSESIADGLTRLKSALKYVDCKLSEPFLQLAFLALPVIPSLKLTDKGLFDVTKMKKISLKA